MMDSFLYSLKTCLLLDDEKWLLATLDVDNLKAINLKHGYDGANDIINKIGIIIYNFCNEMGMKRKGFRNQYIDGKGDMFSILIRYSKKIENAERAINNLMQQINDETNETVTVGLTKMKSNDTEISWIERSIELMKRAKNEQDGNGIYSDIYEIIDDDQSDVKEMENNITKSGLKDESSLEVKGNEIVSNEDGNWILSIIDADNAGMYRYQLCVH